MRALIEFINNFTRCVRLENEYRWNDDYRKFIIE